MTALKCVLRLVQTIVSAWREKSLVRVSVGEGLPRILLKYQLKRLILNPRAATHPLSMATDKENWLGCSCFYKLYYRQR